MRFVAVEFDAQALILVEIVEIALALTVHDPGLPDGGRQAMWSFDFVQIATFEQGMDTRADFG